MTATPGSKRKRKSAANFVATGPTARTVSKGNGCFGFFDLAPGVYRVTAQCDAWAADRLVSLQGQNDVEIVPLDPAATPLPPPHVKIVLAARTADAEADRIVSADAAEGPPRADPACPGTRLVEFV